MNALALLSTLLGFLSGSVMYSYLIPRLICGKDVRANAPDHNPGAANAARTCGKWTGILCGVLDVFKGFAPVFISCLLHIAVGWAMVPIVIAPAFGHAFSPMLHFKGGKAIAPAYGALLGLLPWHMVGLVLACSMIATILLIKHHPTAVSAAALLNIILVTVIFKGDLPARLTSYLISALLVCKHWPETKAFLFERSDNEQRRRAA